MVTFLFHVLTYFYILQISFLEFGKSEEIDCGFASFFCLDGCSTAVADSARSLARCLGRVKRVMSARASGMVVRNLEPVTDNIGEQEEHFILDAHISLSLPPISPRTGEINGRQAQSLIVAGHRSTYRPLLASVFNAQPAWVHLANHNSSASA